MWSVFFVLLSYLDRNVVRGDLLSRALDAEKQSKEMYYVINGTLCAKMLLVGANVLCQVSDGAEVVRTVVSPAGKLLNCSVVANRGEVRSFLKVCRLGLKERRAEQRLEARYARMDKAMLMCREFREGSERSGSHEEGGETTGREVEEVLKRSKRGFTYPGTLWCGAGNMADDYDELGEFANTDSCCRTHDHCPHVIHAFSSKYGYTNFKWHSLSHCDCDDAFKACLNQVNDTSSRVVGQAFFNVIGVPCFDFAYEEQCAERHWYGLCKRYEMFPIAMVREAVSYDYGGIDVIDELTLASPRREESKKSSEEERREATTQSTTPEPSLRNVVTAAEDFIKVLATVSTSQSSNTDANKEETQASERTKKKKKNHGKKKKTNIKHKGKGKGKKRKVKAEAGVKAEEGATVSPPVSKAEDASALNNFINESNKHSWSRMNPNRVDERNFEPRRTQEPSNEVMKDEPAMDKEQVSITSSLTVQQKVAELEMEEIKEEVSLSENLMANAPPKTDTREKRKRGRQKSKKTSPPSSPDHLGSNAVDTAPTITDLLPAAGAAGQHSSAITSTTSVSITAPKPQICRPKKREDKVETKKRKKVSSDAPIVSSDPPNSSAENRTTFPHVSAMSPTIAPDPSSELQLLNTPFHRADSQVTALSPDFTALKRRRSKQRAQRNRTRKTAILSSSQNLLGSHSGTKNVNPVLTTPSSLTARLSPVSTATLQGTRTHNEGRLLTATTPTVAPTLHVRSSKGQKSSLKQNQPETLSIYAAELTSEKPWTTTSPVPSWSPLQVSIERAKAQFSRKKRRKASVLSRQQ